MAVFTERDYGEKLNEKVKNIPHTTVFDLMTTIYNYMSECYNRSDVLNRTKAVTVIADEISQELLTELEGLEP